MKLPSKFLTYKESVISRFPLILNILKVQGYTPLELYNRMQSSFDDINDFIDTLTCLYALGRITYDAKTEMIKYAL